MFRTIPNDGTMVRRIVSGGQTGVDRAALDAASNVGVETGGWCPKGRRAEDGPIAARYPLRETPSPDYTERTTWNVRDSDATLVLTTEDDSEGTELTRRTAEAMGKPVYVVRLPAPGAVADVADWIASNRITILNVAGPRASESADIYPHAYAFVRELLTRNSSSGA